MKSLLEFSERFGSMLSALLLGLVYYLVLGPFAVLYRLFADPLRLRRPVQSNWSTWPSGNQGLKRARRQD